MRCELCEQKEIIEDVFIHHMKIMTEEYSDKKSKERELANKDLSRPRDYICGMAPCLRPEQDLCRRSKSECSCFLYGSSQSQFLYRAMSRHADNL